MNIFKVDALAGAGKTYAALEHAATRSITGSKTIILQPTKVLIDESINSLRQRFPDVKVRAIHSDTADQPIPEIMRHLKAVGSEGEVLFITHAAFFKLPHFHRRKDWNLIVDEIPQIVQPFEFQIPETHRFITDHFSVSQHNLEYGYAEPENITALRKIAENKRRDEVWSNFSVFAAALISDHWRVYISDRHHAQLIEGKGDGRIQAFGVMSPSIFEAFKSATIMGACFDDSLLAKLWGASVKFTDHPVKSRLRYSQHDNSEHLTILYACEEDWSKNFRDKIVSKASANIQVFDHVIECVTAKFEGQPFAWMANNDIADALLPHPGQRLPNAPHGMNSFDHLHNAVVLSALNPSPAQFAYLDQKGLNGETVRTALYRQAVYQAAMRISLRNPNDHNPKTVIVMDRSTADWLNLLFPKASVARLRGMDALPTVMKGKAGRFKIHQTNGQKQAAHREHRNKELLCQLDILNGTDWVKGKYPDITATVQPRMTELAGSAVRDMLPVSGGTAFASIYATEPLDHLSYDDDDIFIASLRKCGSETIRSKHENPLISPAHFDPDMATDTDRGLANIRSLRGFWLDNDGGDLTPDQFASIFPRVRMAIFNSHSSTRSRLRWRAFIPTTTSMSIDVYKLVGDNIMRLVNKAGYWSDKQLAKDSRIKSRLLHGFDMSKLVPSSLFYLPCRAKDDSGNFFKDYNDDKRLPLDPYFWVMESVLAQLPARHRAQAAQPSLPSKIVRATSSAQYRTSEQRVVAAIEEWRNAMRGDGHQAFFRLGAKLIYAGLCASDAETILYEEAGNGLSPRERRAEIKNNMKNLRKLERSLPLASY